ncbi:MAG: hypothetical protein JOZ41_19335, partial [Chloroflexi bacterium]|nr:hypothetical protein [Chloroflexota bacterium]
YADTLEALLLQLRDAEQLRELLVELSLLGLTRDQYDDLTSILGKVMRELWQCKTALERAEPGA